MTIALEDVDANVRVGREVKTWMVRRGVTQAGLADSLGYSQPQMSKRLRGVMAFRIDELFAVAAYLEVSLADLLGQQLTQERPPSAVRTRASEKLPQLDSNQQPLD
ncbi:helix-turn-helix domain-containing protein [Nesterenkonia marinintestina]|uniref:helix-turn-helix domain-containing protein n=1 Tax=Nesterenkonia marinintestina TaxID=2979865 RepID=UPI0036F39FF3